MWTLLIRLEGPMQSWGVSSRFTERDTGSVPSKSGVIGLLCAALGKPRMELEGGGNLPSLAELNRLRMGVRTDRPGRIGVDFQTAGGGRLGQREYGVAKANRKTPQSVMSWRYFLQDAVFLVGLESGDPGLLQRLHDALRNPVWPLYLGRKAYVPGVPPYMPDGLCEGNLENVLSTYPLLCSDAESPLRLVLEQADPLGNERCMDVPLCFSRRQFGLRYVSNTLIPAPTKEAD